LLALSPTLNHLSLSAARGSALLALLLSPPIAGENFESFKDFYVIFPQFEKECTEYCFSSSSTAI